MTIQNKVAFSHVADLVDSLDYTFYVLPNTTTTACWATLPNGFQVGYGESACVDPTNFDVALGEKYAKERAVAEATNELWKLEGYLLKVTGKTSERL